MRLFTKSHPLTLLKEPGWIKKAFEAGLCAEKRCTMHSREQFFLFGNQSPSSVGGSAQLLVLLQEDVRQ